MLSTRSVRAAALSAAALTSLAPSAWAQCEPHLSVPDASALPSGVAVSSTMWDPDGTGPLPPVLVIGGSMNFGAYPTWVPAQVIAWDGTTTTNMSQGFDIQDDHVNAVTSWNGQLIAAGRFQYVNDLFFNNIGRWDVATSSWQAMGDGLDNWFSPTVQTLAEYNGELIAGGDFDHSGLTLLSHVARWDGASWQPLGSINGTVYKLLPFNGDLIALGDFTVADGASARHVARWDGSSWHAMGDLPGSISASCDLVAWNGSLIAAVRFQTSGHSVFRWNGHDGWLPVGQDSSYEFTCLSVQEGELFAGGDLYLMRLIPGAELWWEVTELHGMRILRLDSFGPELILLYTSVDDPTWARWIDDPAPWVLENPSAVNAVAGDSVSFSATPWTAGYEADGPITYAWTRDGKPIADGPEGASPGGGTVTGAATTTLAISGVQLSDAGAYRFVVSNDCGGRASAPAALAVVGGCPTDFNHDGTVNSTDVSDFINAWFEDQLFGTLLTDWDHNGVSNSTDVSFFINDWFADTAAGCS